MKIIFAAMFFIFLGACQPLPPQTRECLDLQGGDSRQLVVVTSKQNTPIHEVAIRLYEKSDNSWQKKGDLIDAVAGRNGIAPVGEKREGDGRTPAGVYRLERGFGYLPLSTRIPYIVLDREMIWVDDPKSPLYNTLTTKAKGGSVSHEIMRRDDDLYKYGLVIEHNTNPVVPGNGSAIFFHVWGGPEVATSGCIAMPENSMIDILRWVDPAKKPVTVISPPEACLH